MDNISISSFTYCDKVQKIFTPNGPVSRIINPLQELSPVSIPSNYTFSIVCIISGIKSNPANHLKVTFENPEGEILEKIEQQNCNPPKNPNTNEDEAYSMQLDIELRNVVLNQTGIYNTRITFNDIELGLYRISVNKSKNANEK